MNNFLVYILKSKVNNKHYFGHTSNLEKRLSDHNSGLSTYTKKFKPWELIYFEEFSTRSEAMKREKFFKSISGYHWLKENNSI
ncbi:MAG: GIY-YIG nuclease family protein [Ignavibacteriales bacterium]|nr:MAG: GIY-YIG nuclease family protein [Ignavibacteriales bacterium]